MAELSESSRWLYERWLAIAERFSTEVALIDAASERSWTFQQLAAESEREVSPDSRIIYPSNHSPEFLFSVLSAWRNGKITCPLDHGQAALPEGELPEGGAHLKLTSATSGAAKCIVFRATQLAADAENIVSTMGLRPEWPNLGCISLAHSYGFSNLILPLVLHGVPLILVAAPLPQIIMRAALSFVGVTIPAVPALWRTWHAANSIPPNVKLAISAGAPLPLAIEEQVFRSRGLKIHNFYGSSECGGIAFDRSETPRADETFAGTALDNVSLSMSESGTLVVEGQAVGEGYWPEAQPGLGSKRFATTDLAVITDGKVYLRGRLTDVINVAGRKAAPELIEAAIRTHPSVTDCVVFAVHDAAGDRFQTIAACVNARTPLEVRELSRFLSQTLPSWQIPRRWWFTHELQPNERGKISRAEWSKRFLEANSSES